jgi:hypothetical protein
MQMPRDPLTQAYPAAVAIELLGCEQVADIVDRSPSTIRDWADPNRPACPNQMQMLAIDLRCLEKYGAAPFSEWFRVGAVYKTSGPQEPVAKQTLKIGVALGKLQALLHDSYDAGKTNTQQREEIYQAYSDLRRVVDNLEASFARVEKLQISRSRNHG